MPQNVTIHINRFRYFPAGDMPPPTLDPGEVHLWWSVLDLPDAHTASLAATLSREEMTRVDRLGGDRRARFIAAHGILRILLGRYLNQRPEAIPCCCDTSGKPRLMDSGAPPMLHFSLSHSHEMGLFGFCANRVIGVDIEQIRPVGTMDAIAKRFLSGPEREALGKAGLLRKPALFFQLWTMKEACVKATGEGLRGLKEMEIPDGRAAGDHEDKGLITDRSGRPWLIRPVALPGGYAAAVAVEAYPRQ